MVVGDNKLVGWEICRYLVDAHLDVLPQGEIECDDEHLVASTQLAHYGFVCRDERQDLDCLTTYPTRLLMPRKRFVRSADTFAMHRVYGSWRKRKFSRRIELTVTHWINVVRYALLRR